MICSLRACGVEVKGIPGRKSGLKGKGATQVIVTFHPFQKDFQ